MLHVLAQDYKVDAQNGIKNPLGMSGIRLEANAYLVSCAVYAKRNFELCINRCGIEIEKIILNLEIKT